MATVTSLAPLPGGIPLTGAVGVSSTSPAIVVGESSGTNSITLALGNIGGVKTLNTQNGDLNVIMSDGMGIVESTGGNLLLHPYFPLTGTATTATMVASNLNNAMAWQGGGGPPVVSTVAYVPGAVVIYSGSTFVCLVAQPIGSAIPVSGANWQSIGGGSSGGSSITGGGATVACDDPSGSGSITINTTAGTAGFVVIEGNEIDLTANTGGIGIQLKSDQTGFITITPGQGSSSAAGGSVLYNCGAFDTVEDYGVGAVVTYNGETWVSLNYNSGSTTPPAVGADWELIGGGGGGNWNYKGAFNTTTNTAYDLNDVVFDSVTITQTYICILAYTTATPYPAPSTNPTNWKLFATNASSSGGGSSISNGTAPNTGEVSISTLGNITMLGQGTANINLQTDPTGFIDINGGKNITFTGGTPGTGSDAGSVIVGHQTGGSPATVGLYVGSTQLLFNNVPVGSGGNWSYRGIWATGQSYETNDVVFDTVNTSETYVCVEQNVAGATPPSSDTLQWTLFATNSGSGVANPMTVPNISSGNQWVSGSAYDAGSVVYSPTDPYNWFLCYLPVPTGNTTDPQADVSAGTFGQGTYWQLLAAAGFITTSGTTPGTYYGPLTLTGTGITSTDLTTGTVTINAPTSIANGGGQIAIDTSGNVVATGTVFKANPTGDVSLGTTGSGVLTLDTSVDTFIKIFPTGEINIKADDSAGTKNDITISTADSVTGTSDIYVETGVEGSLLVSAGGIQMSANNSFQLDTDIGASILVGENPDTFPQTSMTVQTGGVVNTMFVTTDSYTPSDPKRFTVGMRLTQSQLFYGGRNPATGAAFQYITCDAFSGISGAPSSTGLSMSATGLWWNGTLIAGTP